MPLRPSHPANWRELLPPELQQFGEKFEDFALRISRSLNDLTTTVYGGQPTFGAPGGSGGSGGGIGSGSGGTGTYAIDSASTVLPGHLVHVSSYGTCYPAISTMASRYCNGWCVSVSGGMATVSGDNAGAKIMVLSADRSAVTNRMWLSRIPGIATSIDPTATGNTLGSGVFEWKQEVGWQAGPRASSGMLAPFIFRAGDAVSWWH